MKITVTCERVSKEIELSDEMIVDYVVNEAGWVEIGRCLDDVASVVGIEYDNTSIVPVSKVFLISSEDETVKYRGWMRYPPSWGETFNFCPAAAFPTMWGSPLVRNRQEVFGRFDDDEEPRPAWADDLEVLVKRVSPGYEDEDESYISTEALFRRVYVWWDYDKKPIRDVGTIEFGSRKPDNSAAGLYRLLFLAGPRNMDFFDMYKRCLFDLVSPDQRFKASIDLFKYELAVYFEADPILVEEDLPWRGVHVTYGGPRNDRPLRCTSAWGRLWGKTLIRLSNTEITMYSGNDFSV